jgi:TonB-linked SusC/RagA family outer membrane protein
MRLFKNLKLRATCNAILVFFALLLFNPAITQTVVNGTVIVKGKVVSEKDGQPLAGVSVQNSKRTVGTTTDDNGNFTIHVPKGTKSLLFSHVGYVVKEEAIRDQSDLEVHLSPTVSNLDEVVVVGYGTQKKINQTGSVETVHLGDAVNQPVTNSAQLMYGKFSGVQITQSSGLPGADASSIVIRGVGTFGNATPLVVIDNIQYSDLTAFNNLAPSDIESISVLKDASASAIYGARGANGVIVVTTKQGKKGAMSVVYNGYVGTQKATVVPQYLNAVDYATLRDEADINTNGPTAPLRYSAANIQAIKDGSNPDQYANTNWARAILRTAPIQNHYLSFSGGNDKTTYRASLSYLNQDAIVQGKFKSQRYTLSLNINSQVKKWLNISNVTNAYWDVFNGPAGGPNAITGETGIINQFQRSAPTVPVYYSNGQYGIVDGSYQNVNFSFPITNAIRTGNLGLYRDDNINIADRFGVKVNFTKDLSFETSGSVNLNFDNNTNFVPTYVSNDWAGNLVTQNLVNTLTKNSGFQYRLLNENILRYTKKINKVHDFGILLGHSIIYNKYDTYAGQLSGFPSNTIYVFNGGGVLNPNVSGSAYEVALQSFFTRINYSYLGKYLFEFNLRRDGSSRFGASHLYGNFPSASVGWRIIDEKFMKNIRWLSELKLRGSWGITGNDNIGNYIYQQTYNTNLAYNLGNNVDVGAVALTNLANPNIKWEKIDQYDIGVDAGFFNNQLTFTADYFKRSSFDVLYTNFPVPSSIGVTNLAAQNAANMVNRGLEINLNYRGRIGKVNYNIGGSASWFADNKVTGLGDKGIPTINNTTNTIIQIGSPFNAYYGYKVAGVFQTQDQVNKSPKQFGSALTAPGDFQYVDVSGPNGKPDGVIDGNDRTVIGNPYPKYTYNLVGGLSYKMLDFNFTFNGVQRVDRLLFSNGQLPMTGDRNNALSYWINRWTPNNPSKTLSRLGGQNDQLASSFYIQDCSYLRLKNVEIGYNFAQGMLKKWGINNLRAYVSGQNILTFTKLKNFDPERQAGAATDQLTPLYKVITFGLNVKF